MMPIPLRFNKTTVIHPALRFLTMTLSTMIQRNFSSSFATRMTLASLLLVAANTTLAQEDWVNSRTPDGQPDLQGLWTNATRTPMERPEELGDKAFFTKEEIEKIRAANARSAQQRLEDEPTEIVLPTAGEDVGGYNLVWFDFGDSLLSTGQTSLIVDPPNGQAPIRESALQVRDYKLANLEDDYIHHSVWDRCITRGVPGAMLPTLYNNAYRIIQTEDSITILYEMIHETRTIPLNKSAHLDDRIKLWMGDSIAYWEEETLVIETRNFHDRGMIANSSANGRLRGIPTTEDLLIEERFTRISEDTIIWEARITDPEIYTQPFTVSMPLTRDPDYVMYEYACHEGNYGIQNILSAGREREAREATDR